MDYILSPCPCAAEGLARMMPPDRQPLAPLSSPSLDISTLPVRAAARRIVVVLPDDPLWLLTTLQQAALLLDQATAPLPMLILSRCPDRWLWHTLGHLVTRGSLLTEIRAVASDLPTRCIAALLRGHGLQDIPPLGQRADNEALIYGKPTIGLSKPELNAILDLLPDTPSRNERNSEASAKKPFIIRELQDLKRWRNISRNWRHTFLATQRPG